MVTYAAKKFLESSISTEPQEHMEAYTLTNNSVPEWWPTAIKKITALMNLQENWDSYGAKPINVNLVHAGVNLLQEISTNEVPEPSIVPTSTGSLQFEWHTAGIDFELELISSTKIHAYFEDESTGMEWEDILDYDISSITGAIDLLVSRNYLQESA